MLLPKEILIMLVSMVPVGEVDFGVILSRVFGMPIEAGIFWSVFGNMIPILLIMWLLEPVSNWLMKHWPFFKKIFTRILEHTHKRHSKNMERIGEVFIAIFIAIPFPGTGAYTAALLCYLFNIPYWKSILSIFVGTLAAAFILAYGIEGGAHVPDLLAPFITK